MNRRQNNRPFRNRRFRTPTGRRINLNRAEHSPEIEEVVIVDQPINVIDAALQRLNADSFQPVVVELDAIFGEHNQDQNRSASTLTQSALSRLPSRLRELPTNASLLVETSDGLAENNSNVFQRLNRNGMRGGRNVDSALNSLIWLNDLLLDEVIEMKQEFKKNNENNRQQLEKCFKSLRNDVVNVLPNKLATEIRAILPKPSSSASSSSSSSSSIHKTSSAGVSTRRIPIKLDEKVRKLKQEQPLPAKAGTLSSSVVAEGATSISNATDSSLGAALVISESPEDQRNRKKDKPLEKK